MESSTEEEYRYGEEKTGPPQNQDGIRKWQHFRQCPNDSGTSYNKETFFYATDEINLEKVRKTHL